MQSAGTHETSSRLKNYKQTFQSLLQQQQQQQQEAMAMVHDPNALAKKRSTAGRAASSVTRKPKKVVN